MPHLITKCSITNFSQSENFVITPQENVIESISVMLALNCRLHPSHQILRIAETNGDGNV